LRESESGDAPAKSGLRKQAGALVRNIGSFRQRRIVGSGSLLKVEVDGGLPQTLCEF